MFDKGSGLNGFLEDAKNTITAMYWSKAALGHAGTGLERGIDATLVKKHFQWFLKHAQVAEHTTLLRAATGSLWPAHRKKECGLTEDGSCPRCGHAE